MQIQNSFVRGLVTLALWAAMTGGNLVADDLGIKAPEGFVVELYAGDELAHDIFSMTLDSRGRVVVAGKGYVKILRDDNNDGRADRATLFSSIPKSGAHGMCFSGNDLICTGDNSVMKLRDIDGDGVADGEPEIWAELQHREHGANGIIRGPDGWFYVICGNDAGVTEKLAKTEDSPIKKPQCGAVVRFSPDGKKSAIMAHGFRNPYDLDFNDEGHMFTVDADGERDQHLPWYTGTRLFDIAAGQHHGWVNHGWQNSWNRPEYFFDNTPRILEIGRGSPTGLVVYRRTQFPPHYRGSVFSACWTLGRVYHFPLTRRGATYESQKEIFLETTGQVGFAPVDIAVNEAGDMFIAVGGRGTRGSVFRVRYQGPRVGEAVPVKEYLDYNFVVQSRFPFLNYSSFPWSRTASQYVNDPYIIKDRRTRDGQFVLLGDRIQSGVGVLTKERCRSTGNQQTIENFETITNVFRWSQDDTLLLDALRLLQLCLGDIRSEGATPLVYAGYQARDEAAITPELRTKWGPVFASCFPDDDANISRELARLLGMMGIESADLLKRYGQVWTKDSTVEDDIHYLIVLSLLPGERSEKNTTQTARALTQLHGKMLAGNKQPSRNWPDRVSETFVELCKRDYKLAAAVVNDSTFGLGDHSLFVATMPEEIKTAGIKKLMAAAKH